MTFFVADAGLRGLLNPGWLELFPESGAAHPQAGALGWPADPSRPAGHPRRLIRRASNRCDQEAPTFGFRRLGLLDRAVAIRNGRDICIISALSRLAQASGKSAREWALGRRCIFQTLRTNDDSPLIALSWTNNCRYLPAGGHARKSVQMSFHARPQWRRFGKEPTRYRRTSSSRTCGSSGSHRTQLCSVVRYSRIERNDLTS
jgi:hypothetical protein